MPACIGSTRNGVEEALRKQKRHPAVSIYAGIRERLLRADDDRPGLLDDFAISCDRGFKHHSLLH